jgi:hypothetical protein
LFTRTRAAAGLAILGLVAAVIGALGPSEAVRTTYSWPPKAMSDATPAVAWYTPLVLMRRRPEALTAELPCSLPPALRRASDPLTVLSTVRAPDGQRGLVVTATGSALSVWSDRSRLVQAGLSPKRGRSDCAFELRVTRDEWSLTGGPNAVERGGSLKSAPVVSGLFSEVDLAHSSTPRVAVTTAAYASKPTRRQALAWSLAALAAVASLLLIGLERRPRLSSIREWAHACLRHGHPADVVVLGLLPAWWVLSPVYWDDGWIVARERALPEAGGLTNYYDALGANLPNDYWLEWLQHWLTQASDALLVWRLPALVALASAWILCRWSLRRAVGNDLESRVVIWAMATAFLGCSFAWGMTVRPEPVTALLVTGVLACALSFRSRPAAGPLALAAVLIPLALAAHQTGIVSIAPLLAVAPSVWRWVRQQRVAAAALVVSSAALLAVLTTVGADVGVRLADAEATRTFSASQDRWYDELQRYQRMAWEFNATAMRRGSVALMLLVALFFVIRRPRTREMLDVPARSLLIGLPLLVVTWSKLPWHFGVFIGLTAVAVGTEAVRFRREAERARSLSLWAVLVLTALFVAGAWSWAVRTDWMRIDLGTLDWRFGFETKLGVPLGVFAALLPVLALFVLVLVNLIRRGRPLLGAALWRVASWAALLLMVPIIAITLVVFTVDTVRSSPWTIRRQNLETLVGRQSCGLADHVHVASAARGTARLADLLEQDATRAFIAPDVYPYFPCARQPGVHGGIVESPDYVVRSSIYRKTFLYNTSPFHGVRDLYRLERLALVGGFAPRQLAVFAVNKEVPGSTELAPDSTTVTR